MQILGLILALTLSQQSRSVVDRLDMSALVPRISERLADYLQQVETKTFHLDLYRLETAEQIHSAGIEDYLQPDGVAVIEWAERLANDKWRMTRMRKVLIEVLAETERRIVYEDSGT